MSMFNQPSTGAIGQQMNQLENALKQLPQETPREVHLKERVFQHEQRIAGLEKENAELRQGLFELAAACRNQLGLEI